MLHINNPIIKHKASLLNLEEEFNNVSIACKVMGVLRDTFYRYQELVKDGSIYALIEKNRRASNEYGSKASLSMVVVFHSI